MQCFKILGKRENPLDGYLNVPLLWAFDIKHDRCKHARCMGGGHCYPKIDPQDSTSTMVSLDTICLAFLAAQLQGLKCLTADVSLAYIQSFTKEKVYTVAGPEFGELSGRNMIIEKALYGLQGSGNAWHARFADDLYSMNFTPSKADPDLWMRKCDNHYEYVAVFVDDILIFSKNPEEILKKIKYDLKNVGPPENYNGAGPMVYFCKDLYQEYL